MATTTRKLVKYHGGAFCKFDSNYDGDTFRCDIDSLPTIIGRNIPIRIRGIDCPEMNKGTDAEKQAAAAAKRFTYNMLSGAKEIRLVGLQREKYFRIVASVLVDGRDLGHMLVVNKHAVRVEHGNETKTYTDLTEAKP